MEGQYPSRPPAIAMAYQVATFYKFVELPDCAALQARLLGLCEAQGLCGTIILALEGINATLAGPDRSVEAMLSTLSQDGRFADLAPRWSRADIQPFARLKVKLKAEIVTFGQPKVHPSGQAGTYVRPADWNQLISEPDVLVLDTRNDYEVGIGSFVGAVNPHTRCFREFPDYVAQRLDPEKHRKVAMFCTGGIRCEKASAYLRQQGFAEVYHLQGGILNYLASIPAQESLWRGECFVFDERVAVAQGLVPGSHAMCEACGRPVPWNDQNTELFRSGQGCGHCVPMPLPANLPANLSISQPSSLT